MILKQDEDPSVRPPMGSSIEVTCLAPLVHRCFKSRSAALRSRFETTLKDMVAGSDAMVCNIVRGPESYSNLKCGCGWMTVDSYASANGVVFDTNQIVGSA